MRAVTRKVGFDMIGFGTASMAVLFSMLVGIGLGVLGLRLYWDDRTTRKRGLLLIFLGALLQVWWVFFLIMSAFRPT
jgi:hypothetical protein